MLLIVERQMVTEQCSEKRKNYICRTFHITSLVIYCDHKCLSTNTNERQLRIGKKLQQECSIRARRSEIAISFQGNVNADTHSSFPSSSPPFFSCPFLSTKSWNSCWHFLFRSYRSFALSHATNLIFLSGIIFNLNQSFFCFLYHLMR